MYAYIHSFLDSFPIEAVIALKFFFFFTEFIYFCLCWVFVACGLFSSCGERGLLFVVVHGLLIVVASFVAERGLQYLCLVGSRTQAQ